MATRLLLTMKEVGFQLGMGQSFLFQLVKSGELESIKLGRARRITPEAVAAYVEKLRSQ